MPAWWKGKLNGKSKEEGCSMAFKQRREARKEKANSADETRSAIESAHPLPLPSLPMADLMAAAAPGSASVSSVSSSGSLEDTSNLGFCRLSNTINMRSRQTLINPKKHRNIGNGRRHFSCGPVLEHPRCYELPVSPKKEVHSPGVSYREVMFNSKMLNCAPSSRPPLSKLPIHPVSLRICPGSPSGRQEELRSPPHPLPLPPKSSISPSSLSSRSSQKRWKKGKLLGRGTFGHVYLGFNSESGQMCAIKEVTLISDDSISRESLKQLNQELNLLRQLSHSNIVQYYGSELVDETLAIYLEYVSGGSIYKLLQEYGPFGEPVLRNYTAQILSGLAYLHGRNTVHRDIKGANILVDPNGEIKLADFGMAKHISSFTSIRSLKGSPYWMAPEVIMNGRGYNLSVDIWSLGCTLLEMATGKPPWSQFEGVAAIFKLGNSNDIPDIPDHLTSETRSFLRLCLVRDPSARPTATQLMDHPFVCDQPAIKAAKSSMMREILHSCYSMAKEGVHIDSNASSSLHKKHGIGSHETAPFLNKTPSCNDLMALPFSSSSSPLLQSRQRNRSCSFLSSLNNLPPYHCPRR